jgi:hypothetical protein
VSDVATGIGPDPASPRTKASAGSVLLADSVPAGAGAARPPGLRVDPSDPHAFAFTPRTRHDPPGLIGIGDHASGAAAGHTLSRAMLPGASAVALIAVIARHTGAETSASPPR